MLKLPYLSLQIKYIHCLVFADSSMYSCGSAYICSRNTSVLLCTLYITIHGIMIKSEMAKVCTTQLFCVMFSKKVYMITKVK